MRKLTHYYGKYKYTAVFAPFFVIIETLLELWLPLIGADIINIGIANADTQYVIKKGILMICVTLGSMVSGVLSARAGTYSNQGFAGNLRKEMFDKIQEFSFADIDRFSSGSLITRITNDINVITMMLAMFIRMMPRCFVQLFGALIVTVRLNAKLSLVMLVIIPILLVIAGVLMRFAGPLFQKTQKKVDKLNNTVQENLVSMRVVKAFVRRDYEEEKFGEANDELKEINLKAVNIMIWVQPLMSLCMNGAVIAILWFGGNMVLHSGFPVGDLTAVLQYISQMLMSVMMLAMVLLQYSRASACAQRVNEVLDTTPDIQDKPDAGKQVLPAAQGRVSFQHVDFDYADGTQVLRDIEFEVAPKEFVAIVGGTGSGKSSLVNLIARFYDVTQGAVLVDGLDVREYPMERLRERVGMVLQSNVLFSGTIRENLLWGKEDASEEELHQAAKSADIYDFIMQQPDGFESRVEQGGVNFSGGQKQRFCIARAMIKKPAILILDDSTSAVDTATEARIRAAFKRDLPNTSVIIIAQRISSVEQADKIVVLDEGKISGIGTHAQLMQDNRIYQEIYKSQQKEVASA